VLKASDLFVCSPLPNVVAPAERPAMLQRIDEVRRSLAAISTGVDGEEVILTTGGALKCADGISVRQFLTHGHACLLRGFHLPRKAAVHSPCGTRQPVQKRIGSKDPEHQSCHVVYLLRSCVATCCK